MLNTIEPYLEAENREDLERQLAPWLAHEVAEEVGQMVDSSELLEQIVREILQDRAVRYSRMAERESILSTDQMSEDELTPEIEEQEAGGEAEDLVDIEDNEVYKIEMNTSK